MVAILRKLLFIVGRGRIDPAAIKRCYDLMPYFERLGYDARPLSYSWEWLWRTRLKAASGNMSSRRLLRFLNATRIMPVLAWLRSAYTIHRLHTLIRRAEAVVVVQDSLDETWRQIIRHSARIAIYDFDDAVWLRDDSGFRAMIELSTGIAAGNVFLAEYASRRHSNVALIPTSVRLDRYEAVGPRCHPGNDNCVIGWVGSPSTARYLEMLVEPLAHVGSEFNLTLRVVGTGSSALPAFRNVTLESHPSVPYDPIPFVSGFHIGVMPLENTEWEHGKCGAKLLEYMAAALPAVSSAVGANLQIVDNGVNGFLARTPEEWTSALRRLIVDRDLRQRMGAAARERVRDTYACTVVAARWKVFLQMLAKSSVGIMAPTRTK
jgi:glycosyltransferase involved in cell wall biosynthesis